MGRLGLMVQTELRACKARSGFRAFKELWVLQGQPEVLVFRDQEDSKES